MSQVLAITNETELQHTPEQNLSRSSNIDFEKLFEKEKQKIIFPFSLPSLQTLINVPQSFSFQMDKTVSKVDNKSMANNDVPKDHTDINRVSERSAHEQEQNKVSKAEETAKSTKAEQVRFTANAIGKIFVGELEFSPEFYNILMTAKNNIPSLRSIDIDDLVSQIQDKLRILRESGKIEISLTLKPDSLGTILMNVSNNKGVISINIYADKLAKEALDEHLQELERALKQANLNIGELKVSPDGGRKSSNRYLADLRYNN